MLPVHFAPLQGFTDSAYRRAHAKFAGGIAAYYTPFLRLEKGKARAKDLNDLLEDKSRGEAAGYRLIPQIIAKNAEEFCRLVECLLQNGFREINLNMGCPFPKQTLAGRGAGILERPEKVQEIFQEIGRYAPEVQFSIKLRTGMNSPSEIFRLLSLFNSAPLSHIVLHPRLGVQQYRGELDMDSFRRFYEACAHPLLFNGDIVSSSQIDKLESEFPRLAGVMIGRGLLQRPTLARESAIKKKLAPIPTLLQIHTAVFNDYRAKWQNPQQLLDKIRPFWTFADLPHKLAKAIRKARSLPQYQNAIFQLAAT